MTSGSEVKSIAEARAACFAVSAPASPAAPAFSTFLRDTDLLFIGSLLFDLPVEPIGPAPVAIPVLFLLVVEIVPDHRAVHHRELGMDVLDLLVGHGVRI